MGTTSLAPTSSYLIPGWTAPTIFGGSASIHAALADNNDTTGIHFGTTFTGNHVEVSLVFPSPSTVLAAGARIDWLRIDFRARHVSNASMVWMRYFAAWDTNNTPHFRHLPLVDPGPTAAAAAPIPHSSITFPRADDGYQWERAMSSPHVLVGHWTDYVLEFPWNPSNYPYATEFDLVIGYTLKPVVQNITPSGASDDPRPEVTWTVGSVEELQPSAFQVVVLPTGSTDAGGHAIGHPDFDPNTGSGAAHNSGKLFQPRNTYQVPTVLTPAVWYIFVRQWVGSGVSEYASDWASASTTLTAMTVDLPTVALADHAGSNTVQVTIAAGSHTATLVADTIEVEYLDPVFGWVTAPIANGMVNGTGTSVFYDGLHAPGEQISYRARGLAVFDTVEFASTWATATHTVGDLEEWWLRSSSDHTLNQSLNNNAAILMCEWSVSRARPNTTTWGIGGRAATMVHDIMKGDTFDVAVWTFSQDSYLDLRALLEDGDDLVLVNPWAEAWRVQVGGEISEEVVRASPTTGETTPLGFVRKVSFTLVEVVTP